MDFRELEAWQREAENFEHRKAERATWRDAHSRAQVPADAVGAVGAIPAFGCVLPAEGRCRRLAHLE